MQSCNMAGCSIALVVDHLALAGAIPNIIDDVLDLTKATQMYGE